MNSLEMRMVEILQELKENYSALNVRAEFEAEGTKIEELLRLKEISMVAGLGLTLKIGGCESIRDMLEAKIVGVNYLIAPMVESPYALRKYLQAVNKVFSGDDLRQVEILCNIETLTACKNLESMLKIPEIAKLKGIVIERVDLCFSLGKNEEGINDKDINKIVAETIFSAKGQNLICTIGGGVSAHSLGFFRSLPEGSLDRFETRKVCFCAKPALAADPEKGILKALAFELLWLKNKLSYYKSINSRDQERMELIKKRYIKTLDSNL